ncbi:hypothetical protein [Companilactobacillus sp. HBUAS56275]|uniref:Uncharacterized protein n=1 Tax=Candidatus Companilactobacillus pullicola TaxID=2838523 RepID=A0A9D1ZN95_9LACO|nr:hypothetical protein [Candidatus Companilactobacillus pullicola]
MMQFGKKVNFRPLLISLLIGFIPGNAAYAISGNGLIGLFVGLCFFSIIFAHYYSELPALFSYWQFDGEKLEYNNMASPAKRVSMIFFPSFAKMETIKKEQIKSVQLMGNIQDQTQLPSMVPFSNAYSIFYSRLSMMKNPVGIEITTTDGKQIYLNAARDYAYDKEKAVKEINTFMGDFSSLKNA